MARVIPSRMSTEIEGDFIVFLIGMRINKPWKIHRWLPVFLAMPRMLKELAAQPDSGFLGHIFGSKVIVQYWRSFDHLEAYARSRDNQHWPAWVALNRRVGNSRGDVASGTRRTRFGRGNMKPSTAGCCHSGLAVSAGWCLRAVVESRRGDDPLPAVRPVIPWLALHRAKLTRNARAACPGPVLIAVSRTPL